MYREKKSVTSIEYGYSMGIFSINMRRECVCSASREICCAVNFSRLGGESASRGFTGAR